jgi:YVTN family beta-propeller protein
MFNTDTVTNTIEGIRSPVSIAYNPVNRTMYITNNGTDSVTVMDNLNVKAVIPSIGDGPYGIAFNPGNNKMYVTNENENSVTIVSEPLH